MPPERRYNFPYYALSLSPLIRFGGRKTGTFYVSTSFCGRPIGWRLASSPNLEAIEGKERRGAYGMA
jgi:hypothetical protein